jgi:hypothetical protein
VSTGQGRDRGVAQRFQSECQQAITYADNPTTDLLPTMLATAAREALAADGAGLSIFTEGPCLQALAQRRPVRVDEDQIRNDWPVYYAELVNRTPYRSIVAVPITVTDNLTGALDLYFSSPTMAAYVTVTDAAVVAAQISNYLDISSSAPAPEMRWTGVKAPAWMYGPQARDRLRIWVAVGVLMSRHNLPAPDALSMLRAHAYSRNTTLEHSSESVINDTADPEEFGPLSA